MADGQVGKGQGIRVVFLVDVTLNIDIRYVNHSIVLADALNECRVGCSFICRPQDGHLFDLITERGHRSYVIHFA